MEIKCFGTLAVMMSQMIFSVRQARKRDISHKDDGKIIFFKL